MKTIEHTVYLTKVSFENNCVYIYQDDDDYCDADCVELEKETAKQLIEILKEFVDEN